MILTVQAAKSTRRIIKRIKNKGGVYMGYYKKYKEEYYTVKKTYYKKYYEYDKKDYDCDYDKKYDDHDKKDYDYVVEYKKHKKHY